jgi:hypothetical protein
MPQKPDGVPSLAPGRARNGATQMGTFCRNNQQPRDRRGTAISRSRYQMECLDGVPWRLRGGEAAWGGAAARRSPAWPSALPAPQRRRSPAWPSSLPASKRRRRTPSGGGPADGLGCCARMLRPARRGQARAAPVRRRAATAARRGAARRAAGPPAPPHALRRRASRRAGLLRPDAAPGPARPDAPSRRRAAAPAPRPGAARHGPAR